MGGKSLVTLFTTVPFVLALAAASLSWAFAKAPPPNSPPPKSTSNPTEATLYAASESTGTVAVIRETGDGMWDIAGTICLGSDPAIPFTPQPGGPCNDDVHHGPFYNGHVDPHGLWLTPDGKVLLVANRISGTIVAIDTATNTVLGYAPVGREPHLATVRPGGKEAWVALRGESHIDVLEIDYAKLNDSSIRRTDRMQRLAAIDTALGPSMVSFTSDGKFAFVAAGKEARVDKINANSRHIIASQTLDDKLRFTPFGMVSPNDQLLYLVHKGQGKLSVLKTSDLSIVVDAMPVGPRANHIAFLGNLAYVTIGGPKPTPLDMDPQGALVIIDRANHEIVRTLDGEWFKGDPHGIWATADGSRLFIGHERGGRVTVIDPGDLNDPHDDAVIQTSGLDVQKPIDVVVKG